MGQRCSINGYDMYGFSINGVNYRGSVMVFPYITLLWDAQRVQDITLASLSPAHMIKPRISKSQYLDGKIFWSERCTDQTFCWWARERRW